VRAKPYLKVNLGALPNELIEAELFGTETGAFTGARARQGVLKRADGGTLFLDELGNLSGSGQAKLLRVLPDWRVREIGIQRHAPDPGQSHSGPPTATCGSPFARAASARTVLSLGMSSSWRFRR